MSRAPVMRLPAFVASGKTKARILQNWSTDPAATTRIVAGAGCERRLSREMITRPRRELRFEVLPHVAGIEADRRLFVEFKRAGQEL